MGRRPAWQLVLLMTLMAAVLIFSPASDISFSSLQDESGARPYTTVPSFPRGGIQGYSQQVGLMIGEDGATDAEGEKTLTAYEAVLREEGFLFNRVNMAQLGLLSATERVFEYQAIILPEGVNTSLPDTAVDILREYVEAGGQVLLVFDPGIKREDGTMTAVPLFSELAGVIYHLPPETGMGGYFDGGWFFPSEETAFAWGITPGKLDSQYAVSTYGYGRLKFTHAFTSLLDAEEIAFDQTPQGRVSVLTQKLYPGGGSVVFANLKLGLHKMRSDDLTPRSVLRTFLIHFAHLPRLVNTPGGKGGIVFNLHVDSNAHITPLLVMQERGILRPDLAYSIHITAGPDCNYPGDGLGFDAASPGKGLPWVHQLMEYGTIGCHGGWIHNYFAANLTKMPQEAAIRYLTLNFNTLEEITGNRITEYSSPCGDNPFFLKQWLEERGGVLAYYSPGDTGSSPTRSFFNNQPSGKLWSFPVTPFYKYACMEELAPAPVSLEDTRDWLRKLLDFVENEKVTRLIYSHPSDKEYSLSALSYFAQLAAEGQDNGKLLVWPMSRFAEFLNRHEGTSFTIRRNSWGWVIHLKNDQGLRDITTAVYLGDPQYYRVVGKNVSTRFEAGWIYLTVDSDNRESEIQVVKDSSPLLKMPLNLSKK